MEVPVKRVRLTPKELELLDLDDDALIMIIDQLDHKSKMQMMATCKRFEGLIGHTHQFYKNFKFCYNQEKSQTPEDLEQIRRCFEIVKISAGIYHGSLMKPPVLEFLKKYGADVLKIKFHNLISSQSDFLESLKALPNVRELNFSKIQCRKTDPDRKLMGFELKHLTKLKVSCSTCFTFGLDFAPPSLKTLKISFWWKCELLDAEMLGKQKHLEELSLQCCPIDETFKFDPENCHIEKLTIDYLQFSNDLAFEKFSEFIKIQGSVKELRLAFGFKEMKKHNRNYAEISTHLLSLKSLKKVTFDCYSEDETLELLSRLKVCNPAVDNLIIEDAHHLYADLASLPKLFPCVTDLKFTWPSVNPPEPIPFEYFCVDLPPMKMVRKLDFAYASNEMLAQLEVKGLREFHLNRMLPTVDDEVYEPGFVDHLDDWTKFINNHSQLEVLHVTYPLNIEVLHIALKNLPLLKSLEFAVGGYEFIPDDPEFFPDEYKKDEAEETAQLIGEKYGRLEHLKLKIYDELINTTILNYLEKHYPGVKLNKD
jgi:hypothetical protein